MNYFIRQTHNRFGSCYVATRIDPSSPVHLWLTLAVEDTADACRQFIRGNRKLHYWQQDTDKYVEVGDPGVELT